MADNGETEQARRMRIAESGEYISKKDFAEASKKAGDAYDRFAKMIAEEEQALIDMMTMGE